MAKQRKCVYTHCPRNGIIDSGDYVEMNGKFYHQECRKEMDCISEIKDIWYQNVNNDQSVFPQFIRTLNTILYKKHVPAEYLLFALKRKYQYLKHPGGLYYIINDEKIRADYDREKSRRIVDSEAFKKIKVHAADEPDFKSKGRNDLGFSDIFGGC